MGNSWQEWSQYVIKALEDEKEINKELFDRIRDLEVAIGRLKLLASILGALGGIMAAAIVKFLI